MDKLRKYIQECWGDIVYSDYDKVATLEDLEYNYRYIRFLLSTEAMFIKWLVENDKIDKVKVYENLTDYEIEIRIRAVKELLENNEEDTIAYLKLLMLLSIQENPIDFLISILK